MVVLGSCTKKGRESDKVCARVGEGNFGCLSGVAS